MMPAIVSSDVGGSAGNIAVALAQLGCKAALLSAFSDDAIGRFVINSLQNYGVDTAHCRILTGLERTSLAMAESRADAPSVVIYRNNAAGCTVILDIDYRPQAWEGSNEAADVLGDLAQRADMVVANDEEFDIVAAGKGQGLARRLADLWPNL